MFLLFGRILHGGKLMIREPFPEQRNWQGRGISSELVTEYPSQAVSNAFARKVTEVITKAGLSTTIVI